MDPTLVPQIGSIALLLSGLGWLSRQYVLMGRKVDKSAEECAKRERALVERVQSLEDGRASDLRSTLDAAMEAMRLTAGALHENSGTFRTMTETGAHAAIIRRRQGDITP